MPRIAKIDLLPPEAQAKLDALIVENHFGNIVKVARLMAEHGYPIGKSTIGIRSKHLKSLRSSMDALSSLLGDQEATGMTLVNLRLQCASIAAANGAGDKLFEQADALLQWAMRPLA
jgi:hypothetical protein